MGLDFADPGESFYAPLYADFGIDGQRFLEAEKGLVGVTASFQARPAELLRHSEGLRVFGNDLREHAINGPDGRRRLVRCAP
jgi:hypothetical protein